jgi:5-hydroxyisourate hydrolase-like protein (transthyretin family)
MKTTHDQLLAAAGVRRLWYVVKDHYTEVLSDDQFMNGLDIRHALNELYHVPSVFSSQGMVESELEDETD